MRYNWQEIEAWHSANGAKNKRTARHFGMPHATVHSHFKRKRRKLARAASAPAAPAPAAPAPTMLDVFAPIETTPPAPAPSHEIIKEYVDAIPTGALSVYHGLYVTHEPYSPKLHAFPLRVMTAERFVTWLHQFPACQDLHEMHRALAGKILSSLELKLKTPEITDAPHSHIHVIR